MLQSRTIELKLKKPHSAKQRAMIEYEGNVVAFCGRRFGKTDAYVARILRRMAKQRGLYWWVGLSWRSASMKRAWRELKGLSRGILNGMGLKERDYINNSSYEIRIPGMGEIWFRTAENPSSLAGEGIRGAVIDEFSLMDPIVWSEYLQGTLLDYKGWAAFGGVPKGINWASMLYNDAATLPGWLQVHATTYDNPHIDREAIEEIRRSTSDAMFRQEYLAEILEDGAVFSRIREAATATPQEYANHNHPSHPEHRYIVGCDWGQVEDYSVFAVMDVTTQELVHLDRSNRISYTAQINRLEDLCKRFKVKRVIAESNGQASTLEMIRAKGLAVTEFTTTNDSKADIIEALRWAFDQGKLKIINHPVLIAELQAFEATKLPGGRIRYAAPAGYHDDTVMALAMAYDAVKDSQPVRVEKRGR